MLHKSHKSKVKPINPNVPNEKKEPETKMACYNCGDPSHHAGSCPRDPLYTRCPQCNTAPKNSEGHYSWCKNKTFIRTYIGPTASGTTSGPSTSGTSTSTAAGNQPSTSTHDSNERPTTLKSSGVYELNRIIQMEFRSVNDEFKVLDGEQEHPINNFPVRINSIDAFIAHGKPLSLSMAYAKPSKRTITFVSNDKTPIASFCFDENVLIVGNRLRIHENGNYSSNVHAMNTISEGRSCKIQIGNTGDWFNIRIKPWNEWLYFKVSRIHGPVLIDDQSRATNDPSTSSPPPARLPQIGGVGQN